MIFELKVPGTYGRELYHRTSSGILTGKRRKLTGPPTFAKRSIQSSVYFLPVGLAPSFRCVIAVSSEVLGDHRVLQGEDAVHGPVQEVAIM